MSSETRGGTLHVYLTDVTRLGVQDNPDFPNTYDLVLDQYDEKEWTEVSRIPCLELGELKAITAAAELLAGWEGDTLPESFTVEVRRAE
jgi:hypothetical protein